MEQPLLPPTLPLQDLSIFQHLAGSARGFLPRVPRFQETVHTELEIHANHSVKCLTLIASFNPRELS